MKQKLLLSVLLSLFLGSLAAQVVVTNRVKRKGVHPIDMSKGNPVPAGTAMYTIGQLNGNWQEFRRVNQSNNRQDFTDTLLIAIKNNRGMVKDQISMNMEMMGDASVEPPATLAIAGDTYTIKKADNRMLVLQDDNFIHVMKRVDYFNYQAAGKDSIVQPRYTALNDINLRSLSGKWFVYKRQAVPGYINENTTLIKSVSILNYNEDGSASGEIVTYKGEDNISEPSSCTISFTGGKLNINSKTGSVWFSVLKADGNEFIFGDENGVMNYAKH